jgi:hypothetical protein
LAKGTLPIPGRTNRDFSVLAVESGWRQHVLVMGNYLRLRFLDDGDGTGKLMAWAAADGFSGESGAYFNVEELEEFAEALRMFPLPPEDHRRSIASGFGSKEDHNKLSQEHLGISVY